MTSKPVQTNRFYLGIAEFNVLVTFGDGMAELPYNYRPFLVGQTEDLLMEVEVVDKELTVGYGKFVTECREQDYKLVVYSRESGGYVFKICDNGGTLMAVMMSDARFGSNKVYLSGKGRQGLSFGLDNAVMIAFAFSSAYRGALLMHSSVVKRNCWGYMFLGKSGTGKSTHSSLWLRHVDGCRLLNDDNPVLRIKDGRILVYGSPWSGKTLCYLQDKAQVGAMVMLEQKPFNRIGRETAVVALSSLLSSTSVMKWDKPSFREQLNTMSKILSQVGVFHLECLPDEAAPRLSYKTINRD